MGWLTTEFVHLGWFIMCYHTRQWYAFTRLSSLRGLVFTQASQCGEHKDVSCVGLQAESSSGWPNGNWGLDIPHLVFSFILFIQRKPLEPWTSHNAGKTTNITAIFLHTSGNSDNQSDDLEYRMSIMPKYNDASQQTSPLYPHTCTNKNTQEHNINLRGTRKNWCDPSRTSSYLIRSNVTYRRAQAFSFAGWLYLHSISHEHLHIVWLHKIPNISIPWYCHRTPLQPALPFWKPINKIHPTIHSWKASQSV